MLYTFMLFLSLLIYLPAYFIRIKLLRRERLFIRERLGLRLPEKGIQSHSVWLHAVSVGEVLSLQNLVQKLKERHPDWGIYFSTLTHNGMRMAREKLTAADRIFFIPVDFPFVVRRFFDTLRPRVFVLAESEFWPNLLRQAKEKTKGVLLINGRISRRSFQRYLKFRFFLRNALKNIDFFLVQTEEDKERLEKMGVHPHRVRAASNLKSEIEVPRLKDGEMAAIKKEWGIPPIKKLIVAGSTQKGEESMLFEAFARARDRRDDLLLVVAPRHPQRFEEVERAARDFPFRVRRRTRILPDDEWDVLILDTMGELAQTYSLCDLAFVGGSLVPRGGHNLLEPAFYGKPVIFGPYMDNFAHLARTFVRAGAARVVDDEKDLCEMFLRVDEQLIQEMGVKARQALDSLRGATEKTIKAIEEMMARG